MFALQAVARHEVSVVSDGLAKVINLGQFLISIKNPASPPSCTTFIAPVAPEKRVSTLLDMSARTGSNRSASCSSTTIVAELQVQAMMPFV